MPWDKDDWLAAIFIITIIVLGILAILWITGNLPRSEDTKYPFGEHSEMLQTLHRTVWQLAQ